jgi:hypothetical protein
MPTSTRELQFTQLKALAYQGDAGAMYEYPSLGLNWRCRSALQKIRTPDPERPNA